MRRRHHRSSLFTSLALAAALAGCAADDVLEPRGDSEPAAMSDDSRAIDLEPQTPGDEATVLDLRLEAAPPPAARSTPVAEAATPLSAEAARALIRRVPGALPRPAPGFALPPEGPPPPRAGEDQAAAFPPPAPPPGSLPQPVEDQRPLAVARMAPAGEVPIARDVQIQFTHAMVPLGAPAEVDEARPAQLAPEVPGRWRWVDPFTLVFEPEADRLPAATAFTVTVPAGTEAQDGRALAEPATASFATARPEVVGHTPRQGEEGVATRPAVVLVFNQAVAPEAVRAAARLEVNGAPGPALEPAPEAALDRRARQGLRRAGARRAVALRPAEPLPTEAEVRVIVEAGPWSAEGPRPAEAPHRFAFRTHGPLEVAETRCGWSDTCRPGMPLGIRLSNRLADEDAQPEPAATVTPEPAGLEIDVGGRGVTIRGATEALTTYSVTLSPELVDEHGQRLGGAEPVRFEVGGARPFLGGPRGGGIVRRLKGQPEIPVLSAGAEALDVRIHRVGPEDWPAWQAALRSRDDALDIPGEEVFAGAVSAPRPPERISETAIDLTPALDAGGAGMAAVEVSAPVGRDGRPRTLRFWAVVSDVFVDAWRGRDTLYVAVTDAAGAPRVGQEVELSPGGPTARTGEDGLARLPLPSEPLGPSPWIATAGGGFLPEGDWPNGRSFARDEGPGPRLTFLTVDDRGLYRPGETAHVKGWARVFDPERGLRAVPAETSARYAVLGPRANEWQKGELALGRWGSFHLPVTVPEDANLGGARVRVELDVEGLRGRTTHVLRVEEFRRPRFEVEVEVEPGPHVVGRSLAATARAAAYAGGPLAEAPVEWTVTTREARYQPPGWDRWRFGRSFPFWWRTGVGGFTPGRERTERVEGQTAADGRSRLVLEPRALAEPFPAHLDIRAEISDVDRRAVAASKDALLHPADRYVGLRPEKTFLAEDEALAVEAVAVDIDGDPVEGATLSLGLHPSPGFGPGLDEVEPAVATCARTSEETPRACTFEPPGAGRFVLRAEVTDARGRKSRTETTVYWAGRPAASAALAETEVLELAPDAEAHDLGDEAVITVRSPIPEARGVWVAVADGVLGFEPLTIESGVGEIRLPISRRMAPEVAVEVWVAGGAPDAPRSAQGRVGLEVRVPQDVLTVKVTPSEPATSPGAETSVTLEVTDAEGAPVEGAEVTLAVVDEAVLALSGSTWPDPLEALYPGRSTHLRAWHARPELLLDRAGAASRTPAPAPEETKALDGAAPMAMAAPPAAAEARGSPDPITLRSDLRPLAHFAPSAETDAAGRAVVRFTLPDDLTRYRARALAAAPGGAAFGRGEASFVTRLPVSVQSALPRFLSFGDRPELPFVVRNRTSDPVEAKLALAATGVALDGPRGLAFTVPAHDRVEVRFSADVAEVGEARFRAVLGAGPHADALEATLPVYAPATTEAFAEHGSLAGGAIARDLALPEDAAAEIGGLELEVAPTRLLAARDAFRHVVRYPFLCAEQRASRLLVLGALGELRGFFAGAELPSADALRALAEADAKTLLEHQRADGGWAFWPGGRRSDPFVTAHALHALLRAEVEVPAPALARAAAHLRDLELDPDLPAPVRAALRAHAAWVLADPGLEAPLRPEAVELALELAGGAAEAPTEVLAWLYGAAVRAELDASSKASLREALANRVTVTARAAHLVSAWERGGEVVLAGEHRADALYLLALLDARPRDPLVEKLLSGLVAGRGPTGAWGHTQENAWALLAVTRYAEVYEGTPPDFTARAWLGDRLALEAELEGRAAARRQLEVPMAWLKGHPENREIVLGKRGPGRMYYRLGLASAPASAVTDAESRGFFVRRTYEAVDDPSDVQKTEAGWRIRAGARARVRLEVVARGPRHHVAVVDRLPAGLEPLHAGLGELAPLPAPDAAPDLRWWWGWDHENLRDTGAEAFLVEMAPGLRRYDYVVRATVPGRFVAGPARAEEMYAPETYGRTAAEVVEVVLE